MAQFPDHLDERALSRALRDDAQGEIPQELAAAAAVTAGSLLAQLSCEVMLQDTEQAGPFLGALDLYRSTYARLEGRPKGEPSVHVIPATFFERGALSAAEEGELYRSMDRFEFDGTPPASKLIVVEGVDGGVSDLDKKADHYRYLASMINDPSRARLLFLGKGQILGLEPLTQQAGGTIILDSAGAPVNFSSNAARPSERVEMPVTRRISRHFVNPADPLSIDPVALLSIDPSKLYGPGVQN